MSNRRFFYLMMYIIIFSSGCGGSNPSDILGPDLGIETIELTGSVLLPENSTIDLSRLTINSPIEEKDVQWDGSFQVSVPSMENYQLIAVSDYSGSPVLLYYREPSDEDNIVITAQTTAEALVMINPMFLLTSRNQRTEIISGIRLTTEFNDLVSYIENLLMNDPGNTLNYIEHPKVYETAVIIGINYLKYNGYSTNGNVLADEDVPWIEDGDGEKIVFRNPKTIYYGTEIHKVGQTSRHGLLLLDAKESLWSYQFGWPPIVWTQPTSTEYNLGEGEFNVYMTKGFDFSSFSIEENLDWDSPIGRATISNTGKGFLFILDLVVGYSVKPSYKDLRLDIPSSSIIDINSAIMNKDAWSMCVAVLKLIPTNIDNICYWIWQDITSEAARNFLNSITPLLRNVATVVKAIFAAETGINRAAPYFYDIVTAQPTINYSISQENGELENVTENSPPHQPSTPTGENSGFTGNVYSYLTYASDPEGDEISYKFDWGDGSSSEWGPFVSSGVSYTDEHTFSKQGSFSITVVAKDEHGSLSYPSEPLLVYITPPGNIIYDDFDDDVPGGLPSNPPWNVEWADPSYLRITEMVSHESSGNSCAFYDYDPDIGEVEGQFAHMYAGIEDAVTSTLEFSWRITDENDNFGLRAWEDWGDWYSMMGYYVLFESGRLSYYDGNNFNVIQYVSPGTWYNMKLVIRREDKTYNIYIDGNLKVSNAGFVGLPNSLNILQVVAFSDVSCKAAYIDDISLSSGFSSGAIIYKPPPSAMKSKM